MRAGLTLLLVSTSFSCVDEEIVFRDRVLFEDPPTAAMGMLGYTDRAQKLTVCGNCHVGKQSRWEETAHADAWAGLQDSGHAQAFCEGCHTVNELGNELTEPAGHLAVAQERYYDVQCESCHGPGLAHVTNPDANAKPMAPLSTGADLTTGCGECHSGAHHPFVEEWEMSAHAQVSAFAAGRDGCNACHEGKNALIAMGVNAEYAEAGSSEIIPITCAVCHDPHDATYTAQLRFPIETPNVDQHLCAQCHDRRTEPDPSTHGLYPHAPEAALLQGDVGWFPPDLAIDRGQIFSTHGSEGNPGLCATCHVSSFDVTDDDGVLIRSATGHVFNAIPCLDEEGRPTSGDCELTLEARSYQGCAVGACHSGSEQLAFNALVSRADQVQFFVDELRDLLAVVDPNGEEAGGAIDPTDGIFTVAEGAFFNLNLAEFGGTDRPDPRLAYTGAAAHNPFLVPQLLIASIRAVEREYDLQVSTELEAAVQSMQPGW